MPCTSACGRRCVRRRKIFRTTSTKNRALGRSSSSSGSVNSRRGIIGAPFVLDLFQKAFIQTLFGWKRKENGYRRFREVLLLVARKNGKSTLLAGIALYLLIGDGEGAAEIYTIATKKDQAKKVLTEAINMINQSPELRAVLKKRRSDVYFPLTASNWRHWRPNRTRWTA